MEKFCVFCGEKPESKTKEHIIPKWLIELTGDLKRMGRFGYDYNRKKFREFPFDNFAFPACEKCNSYFSKLESNAREVIIKIINNELVLHEDFSILLDWFDKVRVGLWLAFYYLDNNKCSITPHFHISSRIAKSDRMLSIYRTNSKFKGITFIGIDNPLFQYMPSCFTLIINNYYFFNVSREFLFTYRIGFPYLINHFNEKGIDGAIIGTVSSGTEKIKNPIIRHQIVEANLEVYQPMFGLKDKNGNFYSEIYDRKYVRDNSLDWNNGIGKVFVKDNEKIIALEKAITIDDSLIDIDKNYDFTEKIAYQTLKFQNFLSDFEPFIQNASKEEQARYKLQKQVAVDINNKIAKNFKGRF